MQLYISPATSDIENLAAAVTPFTLSPHKGAKTGAILVAIKAVDITAPPTIAFWDISILAQYGLKLARIFLVLFNTHH